MDSMCCPHRRPPGWRSMDRAAIHAARSTALPSGRLGATTTRPGPTRIPSCNMHRRFGQVSGHCGGRGGLTPLALLKACEPPWVLMAGAADILSHPARRAKKYYLLLVLMRIAEMAIQVLKIHDSRKLSSRICQFLMDTFKFQGLKFLTDNIVRLEKKHLDSLHA